MRGESPKGRRCASQHPRSRVSPPQCPGRPGPGPHWQETWQEWADTNPVWGRAPLSSVLFAMKAVLRMSAVFVFRFVVTAPIKYPAGLVSWCSLTASPGFLVQIRRALTELAGAQHRGVKTNLPILLDIIMEQILIHISPWWTWTLAILPPS